MRAVSYNLDAAKLMGINTDRIIALTFAFGLGAGRSRRNSRVPAVSENRPVDGCDAGAEGVRCSGSRRDREYHGRNGGRPDSRLRRVDGSRLRISPLIAMQSPS